MIFGKGLFSKRKKKPSTRPLQPDIKASYVDGLRSFNSSPFSRSSALGCLEQDPQTLLPFLVSEYRSKRTLKATLEGIEFSDLRPHEIAGIALVHMCIEGGRGEIAGLGYRSNLYQAALMVCEPTLCGAETALEGAQYLYQYPIKHGVYKEMREDEYFLKRVSHYLDPEDIGNTLRRLSTIVLEPTTVGAKSHLVETVNSEKDLEETNNFQERSSARSWLGGRPRIAESQWPVSSDTNLPKRFLAQVSLEEISSSLGKSQLPASGALCFFMDAKSAEPTVIYTDSMTYDLLTPPDKLENIDYHEFPLLGLHEPSKLFPFIPLKCLPLKLDGDASVGEQQDAFQKISNGDGGSIKYRMFGIEREIQSAGNSPGYEHHLLLQLEGTNCGLVNFWIDESALEKNDFTKVFVTFDAD